MNFKGTSITTVSTFAGEQKTMFLPFYINRLIPTTGSGSYSSTAANNYMPVRI